jgi:transglutaminase/protease-like cytokinesis protein 3
MAILDTAQMKYNYTRHKYVLEMEYLKNDFGIDMVEETGSVTKGKDKLYQTARTIYNWIYAHTNYRKQMEYWLAFDEDLRPIIQEALEEQIRFEIEVNAEFLAKQSGINPLNGVQISLDKFRGKARISPDAQNILRNAKLLYQGQRFLLARESTFDYDEMGY